MDKQGSANRSLLIHATASIAVTTPALYTRPPAAGRMRGMDTDKQPDPPLPDHLAKMMWQLFVRLYRQLKREGCRMEDGCQCPRCLRAAEWKRQGRWAWDLETEAEAEERRRWGKGDQAT
jgi:hypothetical protein